MLMELIDDGAAGARAIARVTDHRFQTGAVTGDTDVLGHHLDTGGTDQCRRFLQHQLGGPEDLPGLLFSGGTAVDLGAVFPIGGQHVGGHTRGDH